MKKMNVVLLVLTMIFVFIGMPKYVYASGNIIVNGIDLEYSDGSYFSKSGSACSCHGRGTCGTAKDCTCIVVSGCCQCYGWSMWVENKLFGYNEISNPSNFTKVISGYSGCTGNSLYNKFNGSVGVGAHIRTMASVKGYAHSVSVISYDANGINITDCNHSGKCQIDVRYYTWNNFATFLNSYGGISFVSNCKSGSVQKPSYDRPTVDSWRFEYFNNGVRPVVEIKNPSSISSVTFYVRFGTTAEWKSYPGKYNLANGWYCEASYDELCGTGDVVSHVYINGKDGSQQSFAIEKPRIASTRYEYFNNGIRPVVEIENPSAISKVTFYLRFGTTAEWKSYSGKYNLASGWYCETSYNELEGAGILSCDVYVDGKDGSHKYVQISEKLNVSNILGTRYEFFNNGVRPVVTVANHSKVSKVTFYLRYGTTANWKSYSGKFNLENAWYCESSFDELNGTGLLVCDVYVDLTDGTHQYVSGFPNSVCKHIYDMGRVTVEPTCAKKGVKTFTCSACGAIKTEPILATGDHSWDNGVITKPATELSEGEKTYTCVECKGKKIEVVPKLSYIYKAGKIILDEANFWENLSESITFGIYKAPETIITIESYLESSNIYYYIDTTGMERVLDENVLKSNLVTWKKYSGQIRLDSNRNVIYAKIVDALTNKIYYICSNGIVLENAEKPSPSATPIASPSTVPTASPSTAPITSPTPAPTAGPSTAPIASPTPAPTITSAQTNTPSVFDKPVSIANAKVAIKSAKNKKNKKVVAIWQKVTGASGYQIAYSTSKKFKSKKTKNVTKTTATLSKLKKKETYYIKVRAYTKVNGKKVYGKWSAVKKVKIKK